MVQARLLDFTPGCGTSAEDSNVMSDMYARVQTWNVASSGSSVLARNQTA